MSDSTDPRANHLLASLGDADWRRCRPLMQCVHLKSGEVLHESGVAQQHVFFPTSAIAANLCLLRDGGSAEIAIIGNEGVVGMPLLLGGGSTPSRAVVLSAGHGIRIDARALQDEFDHASPMTHLLLRYTQALLTQTAQTAVCNRFHSLTQQLCRWLLMSLDRMAGSELAMTQELIATMLGVRRESVTAIALRLQSAGLIRYTRGHIHVLDRQKLEQRSCECYAVVNKEYARLLPARPQPILRRSEPREAVAAN
jgi:CRP-like cAMP-binding protein